jgi:hypothetical protein
LQAGMGYTVRTLPVNKGVPSILFVRFPAQWRAIVTPKSD